jgi:protein tyrosine/serine phosphatase
VRLWLIRGLAPGVILLAAVGSGCRQAPNPLLFGSMNTTRVVDDSACTSWAEPLQAPGLPNLHRVSADLYRGAQPKPAGLKELPKLGIKTVINLRQSHGADAEAHELGLACEHIPMTAFVLKDADVVRFLQIAGDPNHAPVFVHCRRGADRTGLMTAVYRIAVEGWTKEQAIAEMTRGGFRFNHGYQNIVHYLRDLDVEQIKRRAGLTPELAGSH